MRTCIVGAGTVGGLLGADLALLAVKAYTLTHLTEDLPHLFHPETVVLTLQNGIPWWYSTDMAENGTDDPWSAWIPTDSWEGAWRPGGFWGASYVQPLPSGRGVSGSVPSGTSGRKSGSRRWEAFL